MGRDSVELGMTHLLAANLTPKLDKVSPAR
jgi:hypothetical protein